MKLDGPSLYALMLSAANALDNNKTAINNMNVFRPRRRYGYQYVPDAGRGKKP